MFLMRIQALPFLFLFAYMLFVLFCACEIFLQKKKKVSNCPNDLIYITTMESLTQYYLPSNVKILTSQEMQQRPGNGVFHCANTIT